MLLTGANGFTGQHFLRRAVAAGHTVVPLEIDLRDFVSLEKALKGMDFDAVVHLAAISFVGHGNILDFYATNTIGTAHLLNALSPYAARLHSVLVSSSANVYGNSNTSPISEGQCPAPINHYAASKLAMEHIALARSGDLPLLITRPFNYTGVGQSPQFLIPKLIAHFAQRADEIKLGNTNVAREFNDVRMVCDAYLGLLSNGQAGQIYNICTGFSFTLIEVIQQLSALTGHKLRCVTDPSLVRSQEVQQLCGDPRRWQSTCPAVNKPTLYDTLTWMLADQGDVCG